MHFHPKLLGVITYFSHCPLDSETIQSKLRKSGLSILFLEGDCLDDTRQPSSSQTKLQAYVEQLNEKKFGNIFGIQETVE